MRQAAAKLGDRIIATDTHIVVLPSPNPPAALPHPFTGIINGELSRNVNIMGMPAAMVDSTAVNTPSHIPTSPGISFQTPPANQGTIKMGSETVNINGKKAARNGDIAETCNDPSDLPGGQVIAEGTVFIG